MKRVLFLLCVVILVAGLGCEGPQGPAGEPGTPGAQGDKGDKGDTGATGPAGPTMPSVTWVSPEPGDAGVALDVVIRASFTKAMNPATITTSTFTLTAGGSAVAGTVSYNSGSKVAYFTPSAPLSAFTYYTVTLSTGIQDSEGNALPQNHTWSFTTGSSFVPSRLYVSNFFGDTVLVFNNAGVMNGNVLPDRRISGASTTLHGPYGLWLDSGADRLYVVNPNGNRILVFDNASSANGNIAPARTISGANTTLNGPTWCWLDSVSDRLYVTNFYSSSILVFDNASSANGDIAPARTISGANTTLNFPNGLWLDSASDRLYVANQGGNSIIVFDNASSANGDIAPARTISGTNTTLNYPRGLWLDSASDRLYVANCTGNQILVFDSASSANGNIAPARTISGANTTLSCPTGLWLDSASDRLYVANQWGNSILVFDNASSANGNIGPARTISGANTTLFSPSGLWLDK